MRRRPTDRPLTPRAFGRLLLAAFAGWWNDNVPRLGASLSFYTLFAIAPILIVATAIAGLAFGEEAVRGEIVGQIQGLVGYESARAVQSMLENASKPTTSILATTAGVVTFFIGATTAFLELQAALNAIWRVQPKPSAGIKQLLIPRLISFGLVVGVGFLLLVSLVVSAGLAALHRYIGTAFPALAALWEGVDVVVSLGVITLLFAMVYKVLPDADLTWSDVWIGALVTAGFFSVGKTLIGLYLGTSGVASSYGAAASIAVLLIWVYYSAQVVLIGAEFTRAYVEKFGGGRPPPAPHATADPVPTQLQEPGGR